MAGALAGTRRIRRLVVGAGVAAVMIAVVLVGSALAGGGRAGRLDSSFGFEGNGLLVIHRAKDYANAVALGRKGRIVVAGLHTIARRRPNGHPDRSFGKRGLVRLDSGPYAGPSSFVALGSSSVAIGPNGAVFVAGSTCSESRCDFAVSRLTKDGELDRSFGQDGTARIRFARPQSSALSIAMQPGHELVVAGTTCAVTCEFALTRLDRDGNLDQSFGNGGRVVGSFGGCSNAPSGMALDSLDRIVVGGSCQNGIASLARFNPDGSPDPTFGHGGRRDRYVPLKSVNALAVDSHDRIDLAGPNHRTFGVVRFKRGGRFDFSFGDHGLATADLKRVTYGSDPKSIEVDSRGRIVVAGDVDFNGFSFARFKPDGQVDHRFGHNGIRRSAGRKAGFRTANSVAIDARDRIVGAGLQKSNGHPHSGLVRVFG
jgi:uncharacterized delta-60 repeat protein